MLGVFVNRCPTGFETSDMEGIEELEEHLKGVDTFSPLGPEEEIEVNIRGSWAEIRELLSHPYFSDIWFKPN